MEEYAFATRISHQQYEYFYAGSLEDLYSSARMYFPIRSRFEEYFVQAAANEDKFISIVAPESDDDYFEIILGNSRAVAQKVFIDHIKALEAKGEKLTLANQAAMRLIESLADGRISVEGLKKLKDQFVAGVQNAPVNK